MTGWKVADALEALRGQLDVMAPERSRASDGSIGDAAHATRDSDHNPWWILNGQAYVTARDFTHDPAGGLDCQRLADGLVASGDQRIKYLIWNDRFWDRAHGWRPYPEVNPKRTNRHDHHLHLSVVADARSLVRIPWNLTAPAAILAPTPEDDMTDDERAALFEIRDGLRKMKPGLPLPGRSVGLKNTVDDQFGWTMTAAGIADTTLAELRALASKVGAGLNLDYGQLARAIVAELSPGKAA